MVDIIIRKGLKDLTEYDAIKEELEKLPMTWYPDLIIHMVEIAYKKNVFVPGGASNIVKATESKLGKGGQACHETNQENSQDSKTQVRYFTPKS